MYCLSWVWLGHCSFTCLCEWFCISYSVHASKVDQNQKVLLRQISAIGFVSSEGNHRLQEQTNKDIVWRSVWRIGSLHCAAFSASILASGSSSSRQNSRDLEQRDKLLEKAEEQLSTNGCIADISSTVYLLNPGGDLSSTQATFETLFGNQEAWEVSLNFQNFNFQNLNLSASICLLLDEQTHDVERISYLLLQLRLDLL